MYNVHLWSTKLRGSKKPGSESRKEAKNKNKWSAPKGTERTYTTGILVSAVLQSLKFTYC